MLIVDIKKGTKIIEYKGKIISIKRAKLILNLIMKKLFIFLTLNKKYDLRWRF